MSEYVPPDLTMFGEEHVAKYLETDGEIGYEWNGAPVPAAHDHRAQVGRAAHGPADLRARRRPLHRRRVEGRRAGAPALVPQPRREPRGTGAGEG